MALIGMAGLIAAGWTYALATNYSANINGVPGAAAIAITLALAGLFFRHVRLRSVNNAHYLAQKRNRGV